MINDMGGTTEEGERFTNMEKLEKERRGRTEEEHGVRGPKISWCGGSESAATGVAVLAVYRPAHVTNDLLQIAGDRRGSKK